MLNNNYDLVTWVVSWLAYQKKKRHEFVPLVFKDLVVVHGQIPSEYIVKYSLNLKEGLVVEVDILALLRVYWKKKYLDVIS